MILQSTPIQIERIVDIHKVMERCRVAKATFLDWLNTDPDALVYEYECIGRNEFLYGLKDTELTRFVMFTPTHWEALSNKPEIKDIPNPTVPIHAHVIARRL